MPIYIYISIRNYGHFIPHIYFIYYTPCLAISSKYFQRQLFWVALRFFEVSWSLLHSQLAQDPRDQVLLQKLGSQCQVWEWSLQGENITPALWQCNLGFFYTPHQLIALSVGQLKTLLLHLFSTSVKHCKSNLGAPDNSDQWPI